MGPAPPRQRSVSRSTPMMSRPRLREDNGGFQARCPSPPRDHAHVFLPWCGETRELAARTFSRCDAVHVLVNNAGLLPFPLPGKRGRDRDAVCRELPGSVSPHAGAFAASPPGGGSTRHWHELRLALRRRPSLERHWFSPQVFWAHRVRPIEAGGGHVLPRAGARSAPGRALTVYAADPGLVRTEIGKKGTSLLTRLVWRMRTRTAASPEESADAIAFLAMDPAAAGKSGLYWKDRTVVPSSNASCSREDGERLWKLSEMMCAGQST